MPTGIPSTIIFCETPPDVVYRDGMFHITHRLSPECVVRKCLQPRTFIAGFRKAQEAVAMWRLAQLDDDKVVPFSLSAGS